MIKQRTIKDPVTIEGTGLQTGKKASLSLRSSPPDSGINFIRTDLPDKPLFNVNSITPEGLSAGFERRTTLGPGPVQIQTTEHLFAALSAFSIDNIVIEINGEELPGMDGSARDFVSLITRSGFAEQDAPKSILKITEPVWCEKDGAILAVFPEDFFRVSYTLAYNKASLGTQFFSIILNEKSFKEEIAPARTFCLEEEALALLKKGLGKGASYENTVVMGRNGPVKGALRFPDEPVRHKILDLIGDLYILGFGLAGHVVAIKSGHGLNMELVKKLKTQSSKLKTKS